MFESGRNSRLLLIRLQNVPKHLKPFYKKLSFSLESVDKRNRQFFQQSKKIDLEENDQLDGAWRTKNVNSEE